MAKSEEKTPDFDDLNLPEGQSEQGFEDLLGEPSAFEELAESDDFSGIQKLSDSSLNPVEPVDEIVDPIDDEVPLAEVEEPPVETATLEAAPSRWPYFAELGAVIAIPLLLVVLAVVQIIYLPTAIWLIGLGLVPYGIWKGRDTSAYTIFLGCVLVAILTAIYFLWIELVRYNYEIKVRSGRSRVTMIESRPLLSIRNLG